MLLHRMDLWDQPSDQAHCPRGYTGLGGAAYFGCAEITVNLLNMRKWAVQATGFHCNTAVTWVARRGHEEIVGILLEQNDVGPNAADKGGRPLS